MKRREFLKSSALLAAAIGSSDILKAGELLSPESVAPVPEREAGDDGRLIISAPMLQNFASDSIGVVFAVSDLSNGYVLYGKKPDLSDAVKVKCGGYRVTDLDDRVVRVRITGLEANTRYYYRIGADRIVYNDGYDMHIVGNEEDPRIYSFLTAGASGKSHFCVINDTHARMASFSKTIDKVAALAPPCVIWNGDATNNEATVENLVDIFLKPDIDKKDYAAQTPYLFAPGNHDSRGMANRHIERVWMFRQPEERASRDWDLGRNFAVRQGDIAMIGLDTAEDKLDTNPIFAGLFNSGEYRKAQVAWLRDALQRPEIRKAPFLVAFCHIPLFETDPTLNPGDLAPADKAPGFTPDFAHWQRTCANLWMPLLQKAGCQILIAAHQHEYKYDAPTKDRPWAQMVGGGPDIDRDELHAPTVIEGCVENGKLKITAHSVKTDAVLGSYTFAPRKRR